MKTNQLATIIGVDAKNIRSYARKNFYKANRQTTGWDFNEEEIQMIAKHFNASHHLLSSIEETEEPTYIFPEVETLLAQRNAIVQQWDADMEPLRNQREAGTLTSWEEWDKLTEAMQIATAEIDHKLFQLGALK